MAKWLNYVSPRRYQNGGSAENQIEALIDALIEQPEEALAMLQQAGKQGEEVMNLIMQLAQSAQQGDQSPIAQKALQALETVNQMMQQSQVAEKEAYLSSLKCGGKVKKAEKGEELLKCGGKTKKAEEGEKFLKCGGKAKRPSRKAKCGCVLKKVGGKIIEVDGCTELPIARKGCKIKKGELGIADGLQTKWTTAMTEAPEEGGATTHTYYDKSKSKWQTGSYADNKWTYADMDTNSEDYKNLMNDIKANGSNYFNEGFTANLDKGWDLGTGSYGTRQQAQTAMGDALQYDKSNTSRYGFTVTRDNSGSVNYAPKNPNANIVSTTLGDNAERTARQALRQDRRALRKYAAKYGKYYDGGNGNAGKKALRKLLGLGTGVSIKGMMNGNAATDNTFLGQRAKSVQQGLTLAGQHALSQGTQNNFGLSDNSSTKVPSSQTELTNTQTATTKIKPIITNIGSGALSFKQGGWLHKFDR